MGNEETTEDKDMTINVKNRIIEVVSGNMTVGTTIMTREIKNLVKVAKNQIITVALGSEIVGTILLTKGANSPIAVRIATNHFLHGNDMLPRRNRQKVTRTVKTRIIT